MNEKNMISFVIQELEKLGVIKKNLSTYDSTIKLLREYPKLKESIQDRKEQIEDLENFGLSKSSKSITKIPDSSLRMEDDEIISNNINYLKQHIYRTEVIVRYIDKIVNKFKNDKYFDSIRLYFFEGKTNEQIADHFIKKYNKESILPETVRINKNRLVREMQTYFFPNDVISEILGY